VTEILNKVVSEREFSRRSFVKGGGAMVVGFSMLGAGVGARIAKGAEDPYHSPGPPPLNAVDSWLVVHADNTVTLKPGKEELGQGTGTALLMIAAEELDVAMSQIRSLTQDTAFSPDQGATVGSGSIANGGPQIRAAAAAARSKLLDLAAANLGVAKASLTVSNGVVSGGGRTVTYGALLGDKVFNVTVPSTSLASGAPGTKPISQYKLVGQHHIPRVDIPAKVNGKFVYVHNVRVPGMLHGRVVRPRGQGAYGDGTAPKVLSVDASSIKNVAGAQIVRFKDFVGVVAPTEYAAIQGASQLKVTWAENPVLPGVGNLWKQMRDQDAAGKTPARALVSTGNFQAAYNAAPLTLEQSYKFHYNGSMPIGPCCAVADVTSNGVRVFSSTQGVYGTRTAVSNVLQQVMGTSAPPASRIRITYYEGASNYGPASPYDDATEAASIMSALVGKPVRVQFMRWDEHGWGHYGPAMLSDIRGAVSADGTLTGFEFTAFAMPYYSTSPSLQSVSGSAQFATSGQMSTVLNGEAYNVANRRVLAKDLPVQNNYFKARHLRAPLSPQISFAAEQAIDELAYMAKMDPVAFRLKNVATVTGSTPDPHQRWKGVLEGVAKISNWQPGVAASKLSSGNVVSGRGVAFGFYANSPAAGVAEIELNKKTGKILVKKAYATLDAGFIVYPEGLHNNEEGGLVQGISRALFEQVAFDKKGVTSTDWVTYPMIRFADAPKVTLVPIQRTDVQINATTSVAAGGSRSTGAGEPAVVPMAAAIANAFFDATGLRIREAPMTPGRVRAVLKAGGK
jgi:CO/xanthine dehydrogenase Mo-binding subunit